MQGWTTACEAVESLSSKEEPSCEEKAFLLLYSNLGLQLLSPSEREGTARSIEVHVNYCYHIPNFFHRSLRVKFHMFCHLVLKLC